MVVEVVYEEKKRGRGGELYIIITQLHLRRECRRGCCYLACLVCLQLLLPITPAASSLIPIVHLPNIFLFLSFHLTITLFFFLSICIHIFFPLLFNPLFQSSHFSVIIHFFFYPSTIYQLILLDPFLLTVSLKHPHPSSIFYPSLATPYPPFPLLTLSCNYLIPFSVTPLPLFFFPLFCITPHHIIPLRLHQHPSKSYPFFPYPISSPCHFLLSHLSSPGPPLLSLSNVYPLPPRPPWTTCFFLLSHTTPIAVASMHIFSLLHALLPVTFSCSHPLVLALPSFSCVVLSFHSSIFSLSSLCLPLPLLSQHPPFFFCPLTLPPFIIYALLSFFFVP